MCAQRKAEPSSIYCWIDKYSVETSPRAETIQFTSKRPSLGYNNGRRYDTIRWCACGIFFALVLVVVSCSLSGDDVTPCISCEKQSTKWDPGELLLAPERFSPSGGSLTVTMTIWKGNSHLQPWSHWRYRRSLHLPSCYWLILLASDIETNPGPMKFPCTVCSKSVNSNQHGILYSRWEKWTHDNCCGVSPVEYQRLGEHEEDLWYCPYCRMRELLFLDTTLSSEPCDKVDESQLHAKHDQNSSHVHCVLLSKFVCLIWIHMYTFSLFKFVLTKMTSFGFSITIRHIKEANVLLSAVQEKMKTDPSAFDTFIKILRSERAYSIKKLWLKCQAYQVSITIRNL